MNARKWTAVLLIALMMLAPSVFAFAQDDDFDYDWEDETTAAVSTTAAPETTTAPSTAVYSVTTVPTTAEPPTAALRPLAPIVRITRKDLRRKPGAGESFTVTVQIQNFSEMMLSQGLLIFEPGEGLILDEQSDSKYVPSIASRGVASVDVGLRVQKEYTQADIPLQVTYNYSFREDGEIVPATSADKLMIALKEPKNRSEDSAANATPNIIVSKYNYGGTIAAGDSFNLELEFTDTSRTIPVENIVMSVETGEGVSITGASNTYYFASLAAGKTIAQRIPMRILPSASAQGVRVGIAFHYEYVDKGTRSSADASESLSIPVYIPDRFQITQPDTEVFGMQNEEMAISVSYVNKGKSEVSNVQAKLIYDESAVGCEQPLLNLGNFESGKSGTIDFYVTPFESGDGSVQIVVTYEDALERQQTRTITVKYKVDEAYMDPMYEMGDEPFPEEESDSPTNWVLIIAVCAAAVILLVALIVVIRKRKKKKADPSVGFDWSFTQPEEQPHENK